MTQPSAHTAMETYKPAKAASGPNIVMMRAKGANNHAVASKK